MTETEFTYTAESGVSGKFIETAFDSEGILSASVSKSTKHTTSLMTQSMLLPKNVRINQQ